MMTALVVDDEVKGREALRTLLTEYCEEIELCATAPDIREAEAAISRLRPDVVFLDISMPGGSGFDLLRKLGEVNFEVVFVTAYDSYGIEAVKANALDYLLKPASISDVREVVRRARERQERREMTGALRNLLKQLSAPENKSAKLAIPSAHGLVFVAPSEVLYLEADGSYTTLYLSDSRKLVSTRHLKEYEDQLPEGEFIRIHHSHIINLNQVREYYRGNGGYVIMSNGAEVTVSKRKKKEFLERFRVEG